MRVYLIGYMYSGKTTVGRQLADTLGYTFHDLDEAIEARFHTTVPLFFKNYGEAMFRQVERNMLHDTADMDNVVVSTGGGTPCYFDNIQWINQHGQSVYIKLTEEAICRRMVVSRKCRPTIKALPADQRRQFIHDQLALRLPFYNQAHYTILADNLSTEESVNQIRQMISIQHEG